jgi:hypothetical protein
MNEKSEQKEWSTGWTLAPGGILRFPVRTEVVPPDFAVLYSRLAPLVSEAYAHAENRNFPKCHQLLREARSMMEDWAYRGVFVRAQQEPQSDANVAEGG